MKFPIISASHLQLCAAGDLNALGELLSAIQPVVFNLCVRMLGNKDDAADACQEILLKVTTRLAGFRAESQFGTWVYRVAKNHLLDTQKADKARAEVSFDALAETLQAGLDLGRDTWDNRALQPDEKAAARDVAITCTQSMLLRLDGSLRLAYLLDAVFGLDSETAALVLEISPDNYRKRLSRARSALEGFAQKTCGLVNAHAPCRCEKQVYALHLLSKRGVPWPPSRLVLDAEDKKAASALLDQVLALSNFTEALRRHPEWRAPEKQIAAIRLALMSPPPHPLRS
jgi:RNA polymerase sigma factor (sigma-70 family)